MTGLRPDAAKADHFYADIDSYLELSRPVPFREGSLYRESAIEKEDGSTNLGWFRRAVRPLPSSEYEAIVAAGFAADLRPTDAMAPGPGLAEPPPEPFAFGMASDDLRSGSDRVLTSRTFRDRAFAEMVGRAYHGTCAFTGLKLVNGGGRTEAEAAHIRPVAARGPDTVRNGLAISATVHWLFDRGLVSIAPDLTILTASKGLPEQINRLLNSDHRVRLPNQPWLRPAPVFLAWHREQVFKG